MKIAVVLILAALAGISIAADLPKLEKLKLKSGREYEKVTVTEKRPDGISIAHESGTARIKFEDLPEKARAYLKFLEDQTGVEVGGVSTGPERNETIIRPGSKLERLIG